MCRLAEDGWPLTAIAPEGMTSNGKQLLKFKSGAFVFGVPVLPVRPLLGLHHPLSPHSLPSSCNDYCLFPSILAPPC